MYPQVFGVIPEAFDGQQSRYLVVLGRKAMKWGFPKGHPEPGEDPLVCALREGKEETGIDFDASRAVPVCLATGYYYRIRTPIIPRPSPLDTAEVVECRWMTLEELRRVKTNIDLSTFLRSFRNKSCRNLPQPVLWVSTFEDSCSLPM